MHKYPRVSEPRVKAGIWVAMALRLADQAGRPGAVLRRGDADAGGVLVVLRGRDGLSHSALLASDAWRQSQRALAHCAEAPALELSAGQA